MSEIIIIVDLVSQCFNLSEIISFELREIIKFGFLICVTVKDFLMKQVLMSQYQSVSKLSEIITIVLGVMTLTLPLQTSGSVLLTLVIFTRDNDSILTIENDYTSRDRHKF